MESPSRPLEPSNLGGEAAGTAAGTDETRGTANTAEVQAGVTAASVETPGGVDVVVYAGSEDTPGIANTGVAETRRCRWNHDRSRWRRVTQVE